MDSILEEIKKERCLQDLKWGIQDHPSVDPILTGRNGGATPQRICEEYEIPTEERAKSLCNLAALKGVLTWSHILVEEVSEVISTLSDDGKRREELVQLAAVAIAWIQSIDRQNRKDRKDDTGK